MDHHKSNNYIRSCVLFGCLFSFNVALDLSMEELAHADDAVYLYQVTPPDSSQETLPVDPMNPDSTVVPVPPTYTPRENQKPEPDDEPEVYSVEPPAGDEPVQLPSEKKAYKPVKTKRKAIVKPDLVIALIDTESMGDSFGGNGGDPGSERSYLGEMFGVLSGKMLYGSIEEGRKELTFEND